MVRRIVYWGIGLVVILLLCNLQESIAQTSTAQLSQARENLAGAATDNTVIFAGGKNNSGPSNIADIYDVGAGEWTQATLSEARSELVGIGSSDKILFANGHNGSEFVNVVDIYNTSTKTWSQGTLSDARYLMGTAATGYTIVFAGGGLYDPSTGVTPSNIVDIYDTQTGNWTTATLSEPRTGLSAVGLGGLILVAGGHNGTSHSDVVDIYNTVTGEWTTANLSQARSDMAAAALDTKIIFAGGYTGSSNVASNVVDIYDIITKEWSTATLSQTRSGLVGASSDNKIMFAGGRDSGGGGSNRIDIYDVDTEEWTTSTLSTARTNLAAAGTANITAANDSKILFAGGSANLGASNAVDIYSIELPQPSNLLPQTVTAAPAMLSWEQESDEDYTFDFHLSSKSDFSDTLKLQTSMEELSIELLQSDGVENDKVYYWRVRSVHKNENYLSSDWSAKQLSVNFQQATPQPTTSIPQSGSMTEPPFVFAWDEETKDNFQFNFQLSTQPDFSDTLHYEPSLTVDSLKLDNLEGLQLDQPYYWRVRRQSTKFDDYVSAWSESNFEIEVTKPVLSSPEHSAALEPPFSFNWEGEKPGYSFDFHLSTNASFTDTLHYDSTLTVNTLELPSSVPLVFGETYYWRVKRNEVLNEALESDWVSRSFVVDVEVPVLAGPADGSFIKPRDTLSWSEELNPGNYDFNVHISTSSDFSDTLRYESAYQSSELILTQADSLENNTTYFWRVRRQGATDQGLVSEWASRNFTIVVEKPIVVQPSDGQELELPNAITWQDNGNDNFQFDFHLSTKPDFSDTLTYSALNRKYLDFNQGEDLQMDSTYYWRVRKVGTVDQDLKSEWTTASFKVGVREPELWEPMDEAPIDFPVTLRWEPLFKQDYNINVQVSASPDFSTLIRNEEFQISQPSETNTSMDLVELPTNETYYWRARRQGVRDLNLVSDWVTKSFFARPDFMRLSVDSAFTDLPNYVNAIFHVTDQNGKGINTLNTEDFVAFDNENDLLPQSGPESSYNVSPVEQIPTTTKVVMLLDNSTSLGQDLGQVKNAAIQFIRNKTANQVVSVYTFSDGSQEIIDFTNDTTALIQAVNSIELGFNTTDLYGSVTSMYDKWENRFSLSHIDQGYLVVFSDGDDTAGRSSLSEALSARGDKQVFTVGFGSGVDPTILEQLGNAGSFYEQSDINRLSALFEEVQDDLIKLSESFYWFNFASPKRANDDFQVTVGVGNNNNTGSDATFSILYNSAHFYSTKSQILVNSTAQNPDGINSLSIPADTTLDIEILSPFNYQIYPYSFNISDPSKLIIERVTSRGNLFTYKLKANGLAGDQITVEITDNITTALGSKTLTVDFSAPNSTPVTPDKVVLASPGDGTLDVSETPLLKWHRAENAVSYRLQVSSLSDFSTIALDTVLGDTVLTTELLQAETEYHWRVQGQNSDLEADWSDVWTFTTIASPPEVVKLLAPLGPNLEAGNLVRFSWEEEPSAEKYRLQLTQNQNFDASLVDTVVTQTTLELETLQDGATYQWRVQASNQTGSGTFSDVASFTYQLIAGKPDIVSLLSPGDEQTAQPVDVEFVWSEDTEATDYQLQIATDETFLSVIEDSTVTDTRLELTGLSYQTSYYWRVRGINNTGMALVGDWSSVFRFETESEFTLPEQVTISANRSFGEASGPQDYRLVALPGKVDESLQSVFGGQAGVEWQAYWDNGADQDYLIKFDGTQTFGMAPGNGFWVTSTGPFEYNETLDAVELNDQNQAVIPLHEGWNIISNPLDVDIPWSEVVTANGGNMQPAWDFEGVFKQMTTFESAKTGKAFYFFNTESLDELRIPYVQSAALKEKANMEELRLVTLVGGMETSSSTIVLVDKPDEPHMNVIAPPDRFEGASLRFVAEKGKSKRSDELARLFRTLDHHGQSFVLKLNAEKGKPVTIRLEGWDRSMSAEAVLIDQATGKKYDVTLADGVEFTPEKEISRFTFVVGSTQYSQDKQSKFLPQKISVLPNYPNPFNPSTTIKFELPQQAKVQLQVFNIIGRRVAVLVNDVRPAGVHQVRFDASRYASGMYFAVFEIGKQRFIQKMLLVK